MEREEMGGDQEERREAAFVGGNMGADGVGHVKVMTDEQIEELRRQIAIYATITEHLIEMHKKLSAQQLSLALSLAGVRVGGTPPKKRWAPTAMQLHILENMFDQGHGVPTKKKAKGIALELSKHGEVSEANVCNWFQNRRARSKRRPTSAGDVAVPPQSNVNVDVAVEPNDAVGLPPLTNNDMHPLDAGHSQQQIPQILRQQSGEGSSDSGWTSFLENNLTNERIDELLENNTGTDSPLYPDGFDMTGWIE